LPSGRGAGDPGYYFSPVINLNRIGHLVDRADFTDYRLIGDPFNYATQTSGVTTMPGFGTSNDDFLNSDIGKIVREMDFEMARRFYLDLWTSNPSTAADAYHDSWYRGMQLKVNTGYQDVIVGTACPAADSLIIPFGSVSTGGTNITTIASASLRWWMLPRICITPSSVNPGSRALTRCSGFSPGRLNCSAS
jgi:hypothetical protein